MSITMLNDLKEKIYGINENIENLSRELEILKNRSSRTGKYCI